VWLLFRGRTQSFLGVGGGGEGGGGGGGWGSRAARSGNVTVNFGGLGVCSPWPRFNDLHFFDFQTESWQAIEFPATAMIPCPRSGHQVRCGAALLVPMH
jgi:hypothetical protein